MRALHGGLCLLFCLSFVAGCAEVRARHQARQGNQQYLQGNYRAALEHYRAAEALALTAVVEAAQVLVEAAEQPSEDSPAGRARQLGRCAGQERDASLYAWEKN